MNRLVLVVPSELLDRLGRFQGYSLEAPRYLSALLDPASNRFIDRDQAERDPAYKQLIPYVVLRHRESVFSYVRGKRASEARLRHLRSIGLGGHIEPGDRSLFSTDDALYREAAAREVAEEVTIETAYVEHVLGLINDDSTEVGTVHLGIVHLWDLAETRVRKREGQITQTKFMSLDELGRTGDELESWSTLVLQMLRDPSVPPYRNPAPSPSP